MGWLGGNVDKRSCGGIRERKLVGENQKLEWLNGLTINTLKGSQEMV